jgi:pimeloyl-ACP methyl ester carboxylesterase
MPFVRVNGRRVEYSLVRRGRSVPVIVLLHEGLGSLSMWRDFPRRIGRATRCSTLAYSRYGYGRSDPPTVPRRPDFMHEEALRVLPDLLDRLEIERPILLGHSDGASIALIHAGGAGRPLAGVVAIAPHVMVEDVCIARILETRRSYEASGLRDRLAGHHRQPDATFRSWSDAWLDPGFGGWDIQDYLPRIACPVLAIQGEDDEYGTMEQIERIARLAPDTELLKLPRCGHAPHRDQPQAVIAAVASFVGGIRRQPAPGVLSRRTS